MNNLFRNLAIGVLFMMALSPAICIGITVETLNGMLDQGDAVTIIDIRSRASYTEGHIPGAIHIAAGIIARKQLPPIGSVIVCGDGIRTDLTREAVNALNAKAGILAEGLDGGFAAWEAVNLPTTRRRGIKRERFRYLTYRELRTAALHNRDLVLVDIRSLSVEKKPAASARAGVPDGELSDLSEMFPGLEIIVLERGNRRSTGRPGDFSIAGLDGIQRTRANKIYVLIDRGDGEAEKTARRLYAAGKKQTAILVGGERSVQREGRPGFKSKQLRD